MQELIHELFTSGVDAPQEFLFIMKHMFHYTYIYPAYNVIKLRYKIYVSEDKG